MFDGCVSGPHHNTLAFAESDGFKEVCFVILNVRLYTTKTVSAQIAGQFDLSQALQFVVPV